MIVLLPPPAGESAEVPGEVRALRGAENRKQRKPGAERHPGARPVLSQGRENAQRAEHRRGRAHGDEVTAQQLRGRERTGAACQHHQNGGDTGTERVSEQTEKQPSEDRIPGRVTGVRVQGESSDGPLPFAADDGGGIRASTREPGRRGGFRPGPDVEGENGEAADEPARPAWRGRPRRSEEHTSELQSQSNLVCRLLL